MSVPAPFRFPLLLALGVPHGVTMKDPSLPRAGDVSWLGSPETTQANRRIWWDRLRLPLEVSVFARQVHGSQVTIVTRAERGRGALDRATAIPDTDALVTAEVGIALAVLCADCVPILLYTPAVPAVAAIHAGWRGTIARIGLQVVHTLEEAFGVPPSTVRAAIGPSIGPCCYEVGSEVIESWLACELPHRERAVIRRNGRFILDLWEANRLTLIAAGLDPAAIEMASICTRCHSTRWFSYRAEGPKSGAQAAVIALPNSHGKGHPS